MSIRVVIVGAAGRMGQTATRCLGTSAGFEIVGLVGTKPLSGSDGLPSVETDLKNVLDREKPDVLLELTTGKTAATHAQLALSQGIAVVIGSTGMSVADVEGLRESSKSSPCIIVPNFAIGAVLMMKFAEMAAKWLPDAEIIELHHERKVDAPSGTAMRTAQMISAARQTDPMQLADPQLKAEGARGATIEKVPVHSIRLRGLLAHQEVIFGGQGEALTIRHDSMDRSSFEAGILLCCQKVKGLSGLHIGMETIL